MKPKQSVIEQRPDRYLRTPRWSPAADGAVLRVVAWTEEGEHMLSFPVDAEGEVGEPEAGEVLPAIVEAGEGECAPLRPEEVAPDDWVSVDDGAVYVRRVGNRSQVVLRPPGSSEVVVWEASATAAAPALVTAAGGTWVAFHHNLREDTEEPDIAKWIALRFVDGDGRVWEPAAPMLDRDRDREGEEQSFEFPTLVVGTDGALSIFGRGSHQVWRQDLTAEGYRPRVPLDDGSWGCRGRRVAAHRLPSNSVLCARRARKGIVVERLAGPSGGQPSLAPAAVQHDPRPAAVRIPSERDPAARWGRTTLFGDIHQHSAHSDGIGTADEPYLRARYVYADDFCALTDHESFLGKRIGPGEWAYLQSVADRHNEPGRFATLIAYEWTGRAHPGPGHKVVYLPRAGLPILSRDVLREGVDVVTAVGKQGGLAVPHHVGWTGANEDAHDPKVQPVWEICSCHGCYESWSHVLGQRGELRDQMVDAVLSRGHRFGFIASSDGHGLLWHHGVARKRDPFRTGLTAVQATACTREAIFEAIAGRRCYATSGARILLDLHAGDRPMGSEFPADGPVEVSATTYGTETVVSLELVGPRGVVASVGGEGREARLTAVVSEAFVYARVKQCDGEMAWSSPIFLASDG